MTVFNTQTRGHHPDSPSSLQSSAACPHFENEQRESAAATAGTLQHKAAETRDFTLLTEPEHVHAVTRALAVEDGHIKMLKDLGLEVEVVQEIYLPATDDLATAEDGSQWEGLTGGYADTIILGKRVSYARIDGKDVEKSTGLAIIDDWKFGKMLVTPTKHNLQGKAYALGAFRKWDWVQEVMVVFYHPHLEVDVDGDPCQKPEYTHVFSRDAVPQLELEIRTVVARKHEAQRNYAAHGPEGLSMEPQAQPKTDLCLWCAKKAKCTKLGSTLVLGAGKHEDIVVPAVFNPMQLVRPEDFSNAYKFANTFELVAKAIKKRVTDAVVSEDMDIPDFEIARRRERVIKNPAAVREAAAEFGVTPEQWESLTNVPITKIEDAVKRTASKGRGAAAIRDFQEKLEASGAVELSDGYFYLKAKKTEPLAPAIDV